MTMPYKKKETQKQRRLLRIGDVNSQEGDIVNDTVAQII